MSQTSWQERRDFEERLHDGQNLTAQETQRLIEDSDAAERSVAILEGLQLSLKSQFGIVLVDATTDDDLDMDPPESPGSGRPTLTSDDIETSDELATITLAEIFASQGYVEKARTIYKELQRKNPENVLVREKLGELPDEIDESVEVTTDAVVPEKEEDVDNDTVQFSELDSKPRADTGKAHSEKKHPVGVTAGSTEPTRRRARPAIDEKDSMRRFRRWLGDMGN